MSGADSANSGADSLVAAPDDDDVTFADLSNALRGHLVLLVGAPLLAGALAFGGSMLIPPTYTAVTTFMPPQQSQSAAASALGSLGSLAQLAGGSINTKSSADQLVALMQSVTVLDRLVEKFKLLAVYDLKFRVEARNELAKNVRMSIGKKDGIVSVEVDDHSAKRAADLANQFLEELRQMTSTLSVTEAQQRRAFFEQLLGQTRDKLTQAQQQLQSSGFNAAALKAEPKAAAETYARIKSEVVGAEVRLQTLRGSYAAATPEVRNQQAQLSALRDQLARTEGPETRQDSAGYVSKYREFKYQETLFELYARQFELARVDESREGALIQVIDPATLPEKESKPKRAYFAIGAALPTALVLTVWIAMRNLRRQRDQRRTAASTL